MVLPCPVHTLHTVYLYISYGTPWLWFLVGISGSRFPVFAGIISSPLTENSRGIKVGLEKSFRHVRHGHVIATSFLYRYCLFTRLRYSLLLSCHGVQGLLQTAHQLSCFFLDFAVLAHANLQSTDSVFERDLG